MRDALTRVNIVLLKDQHERFKQYAQQYHGSLSQFLRLAGENEIDQQENTNAFLLRPILEQQEKLHSSIEKINQQMKSNYDIISGATGFFQIQHKVIALEIEHLLLSVDTSLSIPELGEYLPYSQDNLISGIEWLIDHARVKRLKQINAPSKYRLTGDNHEKK